jgi:hypothetical protein
LLSGIAGKSNAWQHAWQELRRSTYSQPWGSVQKRKERISNAMCVHVQMVVHLYGSFSVFCLPQQMSQHLTRTS